MAEKTVPQRSWEYLLVVAFLGGGAIDLKASGSVTDQLIEVQRTLSGMANSLAETSKSLAVVVTKLQDHDRRLQDLEDFERRGTTGGAPFKQR